MAHISEPVAKQGGLTLAFYRHKQYIVRLRMSAQYKLYDHKTAFLKDGIHLCQQIYPL